MNPNSLEYMVASDGSEIILASLQHYIRRLKMMGSASPNEAGMLGSVVREAAIKRYPNAHRALHHVHDFLAGGSIPTADDMDIVKSSLGCYRSDMRQALSSSDDPPLMPDDASESQMRRVDEAIARIGRAT